MVSLTIITLNKKLVAQYALSNLSMLTTYIYLDKNNVLFIDFILYVLIYVKRKSPFIKGLWCKVKNYFTASFKALPALNAGTLLAGISISLPVWGLRPLRAARSRTSKLPNPINCTFSPLESDDWIDSNTASTAKPASFLVKSACSATALIKSVLFFRHSPPEVW